VQSLNKERNNDLEETVKFVKQMIEESKLETDQELQKNLIETLSIKKQFTNKGFKQFSEFKADIQR